MALMAGNLQKNSEVIVSSHTMVATASAIHFAGGITVPVEAGEDLNIDVSSIEKAITGKTKAIMPTHLNGRTCKMDEISKIAKKYSLDIYEDAAQSLGSKYKDKCAGTFGLASAISFYPAKTLGCLGDGGVVLTSDEKIYNKLILLRDHGRDPVLGEITSWGMNSRLDNIQAAFLNYFLDNYEDTIRYRRELALLYDEELREIEELILPFPPQQGNHFDIFQNYEIRAKRRDDLKSFLSECGVGSLVQWSGQALHHLKNLSLDTKLIFTEQLFKEILLLPFNLFITPEEVKEIATIIKRFYSS
jgi:dTDP-4-amino-4,6-dideoxygalactose transaminase